jgi:tripartite-type tricarboxylate transporter receptor subunit TctC
MSIRFPTFCITAFLFAVVWLLAPHHVMAQEAWPGKPVTIVVPFSPGGSSDTTARMLAAKLKDELKQTFVVENKAGAGGNIGAEFVARSRPDGYTVFLATSSNITNMSLYKNLNFHMAKDFVGVTQVAFIPNVLVVTPSVKANTLPEFIALAKSQKSGLSYGSSGSGSSLHLAAALFEKMTQSEMLHVPYKGAAPAILDVMAGTVDAAFPPLVDALPFIRAGKLRALGLTTRIRSDVVPEVPAITEALPGYEVTLWNGLFLPVGTPPEIVNKLQAAVAKVLAQPEIRQLLAQQGSEPVGSKPAQFKQFVDAELEKWRKLVELSGAKP